MLNFGLAPLSIGITLVAILKQREASIYKIETKSNTIFLIFISFLIKIEELKKR